MANESDHCTQGSPHWAILLEPAGDWPSPTIVRDVRANELRGRTLADVTCGRSCRHHWRRELEIISSLGLRTSQQCDAQNKSSHCFSFQIHQEPSHVFRLLADD
jgi:hypothetical protein